jgi:hypothetical protein
MVADVFEDPSNIDGCDAGIGPQPGYEMMLKNVLGAFDVFTRVKGLVARDAFPPAFRCIGDDTHQQDVTCGLGAE